MLKAHEVTTLRSKIMGYKTKYSVEKYSVITTTTSRAVSIVPLKDGEEVLEAKELQNHTVVLDIELIKSLLEDKQ